MEFTKDIQFNNRPIADQYVTITYNGFLSNSSELTIVYGFGESWEYTSEVQMKKTANGFVAKINMLNFDTFNFCFRNSNYEWDNNSNCNYISPILPSVREKVGLLFDELLTPREEKSPVQVFDIDALIEEILQPILSKPVDEVEDDTPIQITTEPVDLGVEITKALSQIGNETPAEELIEYSTLDEILSGTVIAETPIELLENETSMDEIVSELIESISTFEKKETSVQSEKIAKESNITQEQYDYFLEVSEGIENIINQIEQEEQLEKEKSLVKVEDAFVISPRQLSKFYLFRKRLKLAFYKALIKIPKMIFGAEEQ